MIKTYYKYGIEDTESVSICCWPKVVLSRRDIKVWKVLAKNIYYRVGLTITWTADESRHRRSIAKMSKDR